MPRPSNHSSAERANAPRTSGGEAGFTLLEAVAAVAILGIAMIPLLALQVQSSSGAIALERVLDRRLAEETGRIYLSLVDPVIQPTGAMELGGGWRMEWKASALGPERKVIWGLAFSNSRYLTARYRVLATVSNASGVAASLETTVLGFRETQPHQGR